MAGRAHIYKVLQNSDGSVLVGALIRVLQDGTTTPISDTLYTGETGGGSISQPFTSSTGLVEFYLTTPQRVVIGYTPSGGSEAYVVVDAFPAAGDILTTSSPDSFYKGAWNSGTTYSAGDLALGSNGELYLSTVNSNLNHDPTADDGTHWNVYGAAELTNVGGNTGASKTIPDVPYTMHTYILNNAAVAFTMPTAAKGKSFAVEATQDGTGNRVPTFTGVRWAGGTMPAASTAAGAVDIYAFACFDGTHWDGVQPAKGLA